MKEYKFEVETIEAGQRGKYQDSFYTYKVHSDRPENEVKNFCMKVLRKSYVRGDMPNPFAGRLIRFERISNNNEDKKWNDTRKTETYEYKVRETYTG
mgnify:CR=1 FL=1